MFAIVDQSGRYYNGRAANWDGNLSTRKENAFTYADANVAQVKAERFNAMTKLHGLTFTVVELD